MQDLRYGSEPVIAIFGDDALERDRAAGFVDAAGARVGASVPIADAWSRMELQAADAVLVLAGETDAAKLAPLLDQLTDAADGGRYPTIVLLPEAQIDTVAAHAWHEDVTLLCGGTPVEAVGAISLALAAHRPFILREGSNESPAELRRLREEVGRIARALAQMSGEDAPRAAPSPPAAAVDPRANKVSIAATLRAMLRSRRQRDQYFPPDLFADPAWDMMLDLMLARVENRLVAVSSLCIASAVPPTTALRWIKRLTDEGVFIRSADPRDGRRIFIDLAEETARQMSGYLVAVSENWSLIG